MKSVVIDGQKSKFIDKDVIDVIKDFELNALSKGLDIELNDVNYKKKTFNRKLRLKKQKLQKVV